MDFNNFNNIDYKLLRNLATAKKNHQTFLSWDDIAQKCNISSGEKARQISRQKYMLDLSYASDLINDKDESLNPIDLSHNNIDDIIEKESSNEIHGDGSQTDTKILELSEEDKKSPDALLKKHGFDPEKFELVNAKNSVWNAQVKNGGTKTLYSSKITVKPRTDTLSLEAFKDDFVNFAKNYSPDYSINKIQNDSDNLLEINIADLHLGKLCNKDLTGTDYNTEIATSLFKSIIDNILTETSSYQFNKILFVFSNDFFNYDTCNYTTTAGTPQEHDSHWQELFKDGCHILVRAIDKLSHIVPVTTLYIGSNHDRQSAYYLSCYLSAWFRNNPNVTIDSSYMSRKLVKWGTSLIYFTHGDMPKKNLNGIIAREFPKEWGESQFREIHAAHFHSDQSIVESCGTICRFLPTVTGTDVYHYENGYTGALTKVQSFIWNKECGLKNIINTNVIYDQEYRPNLFKL